MDKASLVQQQTTMGLYLRDPEHNAPPTEMDPARAQVYRDLVFANLSSLLSGTFPVLVKILGEEHWRSLVRIFLRDYRARTPKFGEIAQEFVEFLASEPLALVDGPWPPFMVELAHYEWVEMALQQSDAEPVAAGDASLLLDRPLQVSPLAWPLAYAWPVQLLGPDYQPDVLPAQPTLLLVRRAEDWSVRFSELSPLAWRLLLLVGEFPELTGRELLQGLAVEAGAVGSLEFLEGGVGLLRQMHGEGVLGVVD
ncbi:DNA-binding domain-containing protein [Pseudomonas laurylsulfatiphila]|uniref:HvfC family RiPP maturation protein n=1 Tax=Pseudomonas laurylsulfatiphila TaxID=2011015 RepID=UPI00215FBC95|nr:putative DNA-binding domain-containing protein [Pseudomonas laurylsulfatiphila]UVM07283.1 putative DNA-binding domain-containing protein [Pseudomonas laurylsulfatiphila]